MSNKLQSQVIGELTAGELDKDRWESAPIKIPFFDNKELFVKIYKLYPDEDKEFIKDADAALQFFLNRTPKDRLDISNLLHDYYEQIDVEPVDIETETDIWEYIYPTHIIMGRRPVNMEDDRDIYILLSCDCEWDEEHGVQIVLKQGKKVTRVSEADGFFTSADAFRKPNVRDNILFEFEDAKN